jgi:hypothetical protein
MQIDPSDRILLAEAAPLPRERRISVPRLFVTSLVLPVAHPIRLILSSLMPAALVTWLILGPLAPAIGAWERMMEGVLPGPIDRIETPATPPLANAPLNDAELAALQVAFSPMTMAWFYGGMLLALALWLCFWQRAAARGFAEPLRPWLVQSLLRLPGYLVALLIWYVIPVAAMAAGLGGLGWLVGRAARYSVPPEGATPKQILGALGESLSAAQGWAVGITALIVLCFALWLSARLLPLPALVARQGWRRSLSTAWGLSRGHGFGLSVALIGFLFMLLILAILLGIGVAVIATLGRSFPDPALVLRVGAVVDGVLSGALILWQTSLGALVVRDGLAGEVDPATFD